MSHGQINSKNADGKPAESTGRRQGTISSMKIQRASKKQPARRKVPAWVPVALVAITTVGGVAVAIAKAAEPPTFSINLSLQIMATNVAKN